MAKYIGMNECALKTFGFTPIGVTADGSIIWSTLFGGSLVKTTFGIVVEML